MKILCLFLFAGILVPGLGQEPLTGTLLREYVATWPEGVSNKVTKRPAIQFAAWDKPYANDAGEKVAEQINAWFADGSAAGLSQDTFRSFDSDHSKVPKLYPQMAMASPVRDYRPVEDRILSERVTFGVQSLGFHTSVFKEAMAICEFHDRCQILSQIRPTLLERKIGADLAGLESSFYRYLYEANFLLVCPAVWNYQIRQDGSHYDNVSFLSPFFLYSLGKSGSDAYLLKPILYASASFPPTLKTRLLRTGTYVPTLLGLFKSQLGEGNMLDARAHPSAYALPESAAFLEGLVKRAHGLQHIPPVTRLTVSAEPSWTKDGKPVFYADHGYLIKAALQNGQVLEMDIDIGNSWVDVGKVVTQAEATIIREPDSAETLKAELKRLLVDYTERHPLVEQARKRLKESEVARSTLTKVDGEKGRWRLRVPWQPMATSTGLKRTDVVFAAGDGTYQGAPAYVSVRHLQSGEAWLTE